MVIYLGSEDGVVLRGVVGVQQWGYISQSVVLCGSFLYVRFCWNCFDDFTVVYGDGVGWQVGQGGEGIEGSLTKGK